MPTEYQQQSFECYLELWELVGRGNWSLEYDRSLGRFSVKWWGRIDDRQFGYIFPIHRDSLVGRTPAQWAGEQRSRWREFIRKEISDATL